jgi:hypothetical protein
MFCNGLKNDADADVAKEEKRINQLPSFYSKTLLVSAL